MPTVKKMKTKVRDWAKIFTKHTSDKGLAPKIEKELLRLNKRTTLFISG